MILNIFYTDDLFFVYITYLRVLLNVFCEESMNTIYTIYVGIYVIVKYIHKTQKYLCCNANKIVFKFNQYIAR